MRQHPLQKNIPTLGYIINNWPRTKPILQKFVVSRHSLPNLLKLCNVCLNELKVFREKEILKPLKKVTRLCLINKTYNSYHDCHHFKAVIVIASIIAKKSKLSKREKVLLILIALCHDIDHQGRRIISEPYYQEKKSFIIFKRSFYKTLYKNSECKRIRRIFLNTYFPNKPAKVEDVLEKIILDADILASIMFDVATGLNFAKRLKHELKIASNSEDLLKTFLHSLDNKSLYMDSSKKLC